MSFWSFAWQEECNDGNGHIRFRPRQNQKGRRKQILSTGNWMSAEEEFYFHFFARYENDTGKNWRENGTLLSILLHNDPHHEKADNSC